MTSKHVTAALTQVAIGLPIETNACSACGQPLREGTPVTVQLTRAESHLVWTIDTVRCRVCPRPSPTASSQLLAGTLCVSSHAHTQTHELCLRDCELITDQSCQTPHEPHRSSGPDDAEQGSNTGSSTSTRINHD